jgi:hypothetical protein
MDSFGNFVVAWTHDNGGNRDVRAARFSRDGVRLWGDQNPYTGIFGYTVATSGKSEYDPDVAVRSDGYFVVGYTYDYSATDQDIYAGVFTSNGLALRSIPVTYAVAPELTPSVACSDNSFVIANQTGGDIFLTRYSWWSGYPEWDSRVDVSGRFDANPDVSLDTVSGEAMVVYQSWNGSNWDIRGRFVAPYGDDVPNTPDKVISATAANETNPSIALPPGPEKRGLGVVAYLSQGSDGITQVHLRENPYAPSGAIYLGGNGFGYPRNMWPPSVSVAANGRYVVNYSYRHQPFVTPPYYYNPSQDVYGVFGQL